MQKVFQQLSVLYSKSHPTYAITWPLVFMWIDFSKLLQWSKKLIIIGFTDIVLLQKVMLCTREERDARCSEQTVYLRQAWKQAKHYSTWNWWGLADLWMKQENQENNMAWEQIKNRILTNLPHHLAKQINNLQQDSWTWQDNNQDSRSPFSKWEM